MKTQLLASMAAVTALWMGSMGCTRGEMERAENRAEQGASNATLTASVKAKLAADVRLSTLTSIDVDSRGSTVTLSGSVRTGDEKKWAEEVAQSVDGVSRVVNRLEVKS